MEPKEPKRAKIDKYNATFTLDASIQLGIVES